MNDFKHNSEGNYIEIIQRLVKTVVILLIMVVALVILNLTDLSSPKTVRNLNMTTPLIKTDSSKNIKADTTKVIQKTDTLKK